MKPGFIYQFKFDIFQSEVNKLRKWIAVAVYFWC